MSSAVRRSVANSSVVHSDVEVRGMGLIWAVDLRNAGGPDVAKEIATTCFQHGLVIERCGRDDTALKVMPPLTIDPGTLAQGLDVLVSTACGVLERRGRTARADLANAS